MNETDAINLVGMIAYYSDKKTCPCFDRIELSVSDLAPIGDKMYEIFLFQSLAKSYEMARAPEKYTLCVGRGETLVDAMNSLHASVKVIR